MTTSLCGGCLGMDIWGWINVMKWNDYEMILDLYYACVVRKQSHNKLVVTWLSRKCTRRKKGGCLLLKIHTKKGGFKAERIVMKEGGEMWLKLRNWGGGQCWTELMRSPPGTHSLEGDLIIGHFSLHQTVSELFYSVQNRTKIRMFERVLMYKQQRNIISIK